MLDWLIRLPLIVSIPLISVVSVGASVLILIFIRKKLEPENWKSNHEVASFIFNGYGLIYAVLVAFVVFATWNDYEAAKETVDNEAIISFELFLDVGVLDNPHKNEIRTRLMQYDSIVVAEEWDLMEAKQTSNSAKEKLSQVFVILAGYNPTTKTQEIVLQEIYQKLNDLVGQRRTRIFYATNRVPNVMWVVLIIGALLSVFFTYFFTMDQLVIQCMLTGAFTLMNVLILFLILVLDNGFLGDAKITSDSYQYILNLMRTVLFAQ
jgi:hypothetical protein